MLTMRQVLAQPQFRRLWLGQMVSIFGDFVALFAVQVAITFRMHGTAEDVTFVMVAYSAPMALIGPIAGVFVDRWNPRITMIVSDLTRGVLIILLAFTTQLWQIYAIFFALSTVSSFFMPAQSVTVPILVKMEGLMAASGLMQQTMQFVRIFSPAAASALVGWFGEASCYYADSATFFISAAILLSLSYHRPAAKAARGVGAVLRDLGEGMRFIFTHPTYSFVIISMTAGMFAIAAFGALLSVYVRDILHGGKNLFGALGSLIGLGSIVGAVAVQKLAKGRAPAIMVEPRIGRRRTIHPDSRGLADAGRDAGRSIRDRLVGGVHHGGGDSTSARRNAAGNAGAREFEFDVADRLGARGRDGVRRRLGDSLWNREPVLWQRSGAVFSDARRSMAAAADEIRRPTRFLTVAVQSIFTIRLPIFSP